MIKKCLIKFPSENYVRKKNVEPEWAANKTKNKII